MRMYKNYIPRLHFLCALSSSFSRRDRIGSDNTKVSFCQRFSFASAKSLVFIPKANKIRTGLGSVLAVARAKKKNCETTITEN